MRRPQRIFLLALVLAALGGCRFAEWIGQQRAIEQERRDAWSAATEGVYNGGFTQAGH